MKVILLKDIPKIGKKNEIKDVADGFAQNALLPKKLAQIATPQAIQALKDKENQIIKANTAQLESINNTIQKLQNEKIVVELPANEQGHLFSKFKVEQLKKVFKDKQIEFDIKYVTPFEFKEVGIYTIKIKLPQTIQASDNKKKITTAVSGDFTLEIKGI